MTVEINRVTERELVVDVEVGVASTLSYGVIKLGTYPDRVMIILNSEVLRTLGSRILDAIEASDRPVAEETPEETPELTCDTCRYKVIVVDGMYKHYDPEDTKADKDAGWFGCSHFGGVEYGHASCTVNGNYVVPDDDEDDEAPEETPELTCDNCGYKVIVVDGTYKHYDPAEPTGATGAGWFRCSHMGGSVYFGSFCAVNGHYVVPDDELADPTVDQVI